MSWVALAVGVGGGLAKTALVDQPQRARDMAAKAEVMRWSPWTHLDPSKQPITAADPFAAALGGAAAAQSFKNNKGLGNSGGGNNPWSASTNLDGPEYNLQPTTGYLGGSN